MSSREVLPEPREDCANEDPGNREESLGVEKPEESLIFFSILLVGEGYDSKSRHSTEWFASYLFIYLSYNVCRPLPKVKKKRGILCRIPRFY